MTDKETDSRHEQLNEEDMDFFNDKPNSSDNEVPSSVEENTDRDELLRRSTAQLKSSIQNIGAAVDQQYGILKKAQEMDKSANITTTAKSTAAYVSAWAQTVNEKYHVVETTGDLLRQVNEKFKVAEAASTIGSKIQQYDQKTGISTRAVSALAKGAEYVEQRVVKKGEHDLNADKEAHDGIEMEDKGKPSS